MIQAPRVAERSHYYSSGSVLLERRLATPETVIQQSRKLTITPNSQPLGFSPADVNYEKMLRNQVIGDQSVRPGFPSFDPVKLMETVNIINRETELKPFMETAANHLSLALHAEVSIELRSDLMDKGLAAAGFREIIPSLYGKNTMLVERLAEKMGVTAIANDEGGTTVLLPLTDHQGIALGAIMIKSAARYSTGEMELVKGCGVFANHALNTMLTIARLREQTITDGLTGLHNRVYFNDFIHDQFAISKRHGKNLSMLMIDLDHFKQVNDTHGHQAGDAVLKVIAAVIKKQLRDCDIAARYGGEELVVVLPETDFVGAIVAAEKILNAIRQAAIEHDGKTIKVTASIGVANLEESMSVEKNLIDLADAKAYQGKRQGRDQVVF